MVRQEVGTVSRLTDAALTAAAAVVIVVDIVIIVLVMLTPGAG